MERDEEDKNKTEIETDRKSYVGRGEWISNKANYTESCVHFFANFTFLGF